MSIVEMGAWINAIAQLRGVKIDDDAGPRTIRSLRRKPRQRRRR
ncbi:hypothetical protein [Burkholderia sp. lig30]|jgi:hypothetical protein|nr:hypothetical protein [Burkholderia sp. lig30]